MEEENKTQIAGQVSEPAQPKKSPSKKAAAQPQTNMDPTDDNDEKLSPSDVIGAINATESKKASHEAELEENKPIELDADKDGLKTVDLLGSDSDAVSADAVTEISVPNKKAKKVNIEDFKINSSGNALTLESDIKTALYGNKAIFQITAAQSGYTAMIQPLVHKDSVNLLYSQISRYNYKKSVFKVVFDKICDDSAGLKKLGFDQWLANTSVEDMETFYYGIYCATFPNEGSFRFVCPHCGEESDYKVNNNNLIKTADNSKMRKLIADVSANSNSIDKMHEYSLIGKNDAFKLTDSGIIADIRTPTLADSLEILRTVDESTIDRDTITITNMLYINKLLVPVKTGKGQKVGANGYNEISRRQEILRIIDNLSLDDAAELQDAVSERVDENRISYSIKNATCPHCGEKIAEIPLSMEEILFTLVFEKTQ